MYPYFFFKEVYLGKGEGLHFEPHSAVLGATPSLLLGVGSQWCPGTTWCWGVNLGLCMHSRLQRFTFLSG